MATYQLKVSIEGTDPSVWRKIVVPDHITFHQLHLILQEVFQWKDYHLYQFELPDVEQSIMPLADDPYYDNDEIDSRETLIDPYMSKNLRFYYVYDLGDYWEHVIDVEDIDLRDESRAPRMTAFQGESMIEDAGGVGGYYRIMDILKNPKDPEYRSTQAWVEWQAPRKLSTSVNNVMEEMLYFPKVAYTSLAAGDAASKTANGPRVSLKEVMTAINYQSDTLAFYIDKDAGDVRGLCIDESDDFAEAYEKSHEHLKACNGVMVPRSEDFDDYKVMCDFAKTREGAVGAKLSKAVEGRGAFKRFKNEVNKLDMNREWAAFRDEARLQFVRNFLEKNGIRWK